MSTRRLLLLRHGRTAWNAERRFQGQADPPLDDVGRAQAYEVAEIIAALAPSALVSSDAMRAVQTAERVATATGLPLQVEPRLRERSLGHWEGLTRDEVAARASAAFAELDELPITVVVTHSATAMALCNALLGMTQTLHVLGSLANCHWSELTADSLHGKDALWRLRGHNLGAPGAIVPTPLRMPSDSEDASDADA